jgi:hypothetical protein
MVMHKYKPQPTQPLLLSDGDARFQQNPLVRYLVDWAKTKGCSMEDLAMLPNIEADDWAQFRQLIGYSYTGFMDFDNPAPVHNAARAELANLASEQCSVRLDAVAPMRDEAILKMLRDRR